MCRFNVLLYFLWTTRKQRRASNGTVQREKKHTFIYLYFKITPCWAWGLWENNLIRNSQNLQALFAAPPLWGDWPNNILMNMFFKLFTLDKTPWIKIEATVNRWWPKSVVLPPLMENKLTFKAEGVELWGIILKTIMFHLWLHFWLVLWVWVMIFIYVDHKSPWPQRYNPNLYTCCTMTNSRACLHL